MKIHIFDSTQLVEVSSWYTRDCSYRSPDDMTSEIIVTGVYGEEMSFYGRTDHIDKVADLLTQAARQGGGVIDFEKAQLVKER